MEVYKVSNSKFILIEKQSDLDESNQKKEKTQRLINKIIENTEKKHPKQRAKSSKKSLAKGKSKQMNLLPGDRKEVDHNISSELLRIVSPKPPKPSRIDQSNILSQSNNSMNISQLLRETNPNNVKKRSPIKTPSPPKPKIKIFKKAEIIDIGKKININSIKFKNSKKVVVLKNNSIDSKLDLCE
jgi:hypothetical protein